MIEEREKTENFESLNHKQEKGWNFGLTYPVTNPIVSLEYILLIHAECETIGVSVSTIITNSV